MQQPIRVSVIKEHFDKVTTRTIERWIKQLKDEKRIEYRGSKKTGGYFIK
jgi:ATP-dependent DNA helicase RecG